MARPKKTAKQVEGEKLVAEMKQEIQTDSGDSTGDLLEKHDELMEGDTLKPKKIKKENKKP